MAVDYFLKLDPIKGESLDAKHKNEIQLTSWSWGLQQTGHGGHGSGGGAGKVAVHDLSFTHHTDKASGDLFLSCANGKHFDKGILTCRKAGEHPVEFLKITMEHVLITSVNYGGSHQDERVSESVSLNFAKVKLEYTEQKPDGSAGASTPKGWDIAANQEAS